MNRKILLTNGKFYTLRKEGEFNQAVLIKGDKIEQVFFTSPENISADEVIDLHNSFVYPGFIDTHTHCFEGGLYSLSVDFSDVTSINDILEILREADPISGKIFAYHLDENSIKERRFPTQKEVDHLYPDIPLIIRRVDGHSCVINSAAAAKIPWKKPLPKGYNGYLNREWNGQASNWFHRDLDDESILKVYHEAAAKAINTGHTTIHTMIGDAYSDLKHLPLIKHHLSEFPVEFILYPQITNVKKALEIESTRIGGCILADGSFGSHTAALTEPYTDRPNQKGVLYRSSDFWQSFIREAHNEGLQIAIHCIGDAAIQQILKCYEQVQTENYQDLRHEIIHCELVSDDMINHIKKSGISAVMQPMFDRLWAGPGELYQWVLGKERTLHTSRLASIYNKGILLTGGSDWYITDLSALKGINAAVNLHNPKERLTPYQAVSIYTRNAAKLSHDEDRLGQILPGKEADMVFLEEDILKPGTKIDQVKISKVIKKGRFITPFNN